MDNITPNVVLTEEGHAVKLNYEEIIVDFCLKHGISINLSHDMPAGYETAYGAYDVTVNTLFLNISILCDAPRYEALFYLFHELRHAMQYLCPTLFDEQIQESRFYVILYNGRCFKLVGNVWRECSLGGTENYFTCAYMSLPYELEANAYAYEKVKKSCGDSAELEELYAFWTPKERLGYNEHIQLFRRIDNAVRDSSSS